jgi:membrane protein
VTVGRSSGRTAARWQRLRSRVGWLDHVARAGVRYDEADGGRLAAAVTYYAFFGTFAAWLMGFAVFGFVLDDPRVLQAVESYLAQDLPGLDVQAMRDARTTVGVVALIGLPITGWFWTDAFRSSIRRIWQLPEYPGRLVGRVLADLAVLLGLGVLLVGSLAVAYATTVVAGRIAEGADAGDGASRVLLAVVGFMVGTGVNTALACGALSGLPRIRMPWRRLFGPALLAGVAVELLKTLGRRYIEAFESNPVYGLVAGSVGLLVLLNAVNQMLLFAAALTATSTVGSPSDLATDRPDATTGSPSSDPDDPDDPVGHDPQDKAGEPDARDEPGTHHVQDEPGEADMQDEPGGAAGSPSSGPDGERRISSPPGPGTGEG